jgi:predicted nuclease of predicted toxin-antitoxin system
VAALRAAGARVEPHADHFKDDERDEVWLTEVGRRGWVVLTKDKNIRTRVIERDALLAANVRTFIVTAGNVTGPELAELLVRHLAAITGVARRTPAPFIARISASGVHLYP